MDDKDLLALFREEGKEHYAFNLIVQKYGERLYWHIRKMVASHDDANDLLQNSLVKVWKALPGFREESRLFTWLYRITTNEVLTFLKKRQLRSFLSLTDYSSKLENVLESDIYFDGDSAKKALHKAVLRLPEKQRVVFNLRYFEEMKYEDISEILGTSVGALKASYHHAAKKIENSLQELI